MDTVLVPVVGHSGAFVLAVVVLLFSSRGRCLLPLQKALESKNTKLGQTALAGMQVRRSSTLVFI